MLAVFKTGGKQYSVKTGQILKVEKLAGKKGDNISFKDVLSISNETDHKFGNPLLKDVSVNAKIIDQIRAKKIIVFKKRQRQNYRLTQGHRQYLTVVKIESIETGKQKPQVSKKEDIKNGSEKKRKKIEPSKLKKKTASKKLETAKKSPKKKKTTKTKSLKK